MTPVDCLALAGSLIINVLTHQCYAGHNNGANGNEHIPYAYYKNENDDNKLNTSTADETMG